MNDLLTFGSWLKERRKKLDLTQFDLADRVGCSEDTIQKIERGERRPSKQFSQRLAEVLGIPSDEQAAFVVAAREGNAPQAQSSDSGTSRTSFNPSVPNNLPTPLTPLIGREAVVADARSYLHDGVRLLTLTGAPGIGKTRLSLQVASELLADFRDGVYLVELAPINNTDLVAPTIASVLGLKEMAQQTIVEVVKQFLGGGGSGDRGSGKRMLLLLDNFEQVLDAAPLVVDLLSATSQLSVLVTSREALHVMGEQQLPVQPLRTPDLSRLPDPEALAEYPAIQLFVQRARAVDPDFRLTEDNYREVAQICARLNGLPLAIELAAARAGFFSTSALLSRLESRLNTLTGGPRALPQRQRTLRNAIDWSHELLSDEEKVLFRRLAVFVGGRTIEAVEAVCNAREDLVIDVVDGLISLVDKSLLRREEGAGGEPRFMMLETIHEYAREKLQESGEAEALQREHALYFMRLAEEAEPHLRGEHQQEWLERLEDEFDNIRAALRWTKARGEKRETADTDNTEASAEAVDTGLRMGTALWRFWFMRSHLSEGRKELIRLLALQRRAKEIAEKRGVAATETGERDSAEGSRKYRANALNRAGYLAFLQGDLTSARLLLEESLALYRELGDKWGAATSLHSLGGLEYQQGDYAYATARLLLEESLALYRELGDKHGIANEGMGLALVSFLQGDYPSARSLLTESLALYRESGDIQNIAITLGNLGLVAHEQGDYISARSLQEELDTVLEREDRLAYEHAVATARAQLGEQEFERAWQEGRAMSMEEAIDYVSEKVR